MNDLLESFFLEELTAAVKKELELALENSNATLSQLNFNRFKVLIEHQTSTVCIEDIIDASSSGEMRMSATEFRLRLGAASLRRE